MKNTKLTLAHALAAAALLGCASHASAQSYALKLQHESTVVGTDGVTRIVRFAERLVRVDNDVWLERVLPPAAASADSKEHAHGHKHLDTATSVRWVRWQPKGEQGDTAGSNTKGAKDVLQVRLVDQHDQILIDVPKTEYANIGFDGNWVRASQLMDPATVASMAVMSRPSAPGTRWRETVRPNGFVRVLWDDKRALPLQIESQQEGGRRSSTMQVTIEPMPARLPWTRLQGYAQKDYSDLLD